MHETQFCLTRVRWRCLVSATRFQTPCISSCHAGAAVFVGHPAWCSHALRHRNCAPLWRDGLPLSTAARTLADAAETLQPEQLQLAVRQALREGLATTSQLEGQARHRNGRQLLEAIKTEKGTRELFGCRQLLTSADTAHQGHRPRPQQRRGRRRARHHRRTGTRAYERAGAFPNPLLRK